MLTRAFFALQRPWVPTALAVGSLAINAIGSYLLSKPFGIAGIVIGTTLSNVALVVAEAIILRRVLGGFETRRTLLALVQMLVGAVILGAITYAVWWGLHDVFGISLLAQVVSVGAALFLGALAYAAVVLGLAIPEAGRLSTCSPRRLRRRS